MRLKKKLKKTKKPIKTKLKKELIVLKGRCMSCLSIEPYVNLEIIKGKSLMYYKLIHDFNLQHICKKCFNLTYDMYLKDKFKLLTWLMEFNNNLEGVSNEFFVKLLKQFNITEELLSEHPDDYIDNITKYVIYLQALLSIKRERDVNNEDEKSVPLPVVVG